MSRTLTFTRTASVTLDGSGNGTAQLGPSVPGEVWSPALVSVSCSATVTTGTCQASIYCGDSARQSTFVDGTFSGDTGDTSDAVNGQVLHPGMYVLVVWSGGVPGATATVRVQGTRQVP